MPARSKSPAVPKKVPSPYTPEKIHEFVESLFGEDLHVKRVKSLANATVGVLDAAALGVHAIGRGLASATGLHDRHTVKQVDRLLSNLGVDVWQLFAQWVPYVCANRTELVVNLDWTEFDGDDHSMLVAGAQTNHGRSTPLVWMTVVKSKLAGQRNAHEDRLLIRLREVLPKDLKTTIIADRGFADQKLFNFLTELRYHFIIRFRSNMNVTDEHGETRPGKDWVTADGRMRQLRNATITDDHCPVSSITTVHNKRMEDPWLLATNNPGITGARARELYGKRFTCEETFRDIKDLRFGMGMSWNRIGKTDRRDRMFLLAAMAHVLLTLLGKAGERAGLDRMLKTNTSPRRQLSLFRQGVRWYQLIPNMPDERLQVLMSAFEEILKEQELFRSMFWAV